MTTGNALPIKPETGGRRAEGFCTPKEDKLSQRMSILPKRVLPTVFLPGIMGSNLRMSAEKQSQVGRKNNIAWRPEDTSSYSNEHALHSTLYSLIRIANTMSWSKP